MFTRVQMKTFSEKVCRSCYGEIMTRGFRNRCTLSNENDQLIERICINDTVINVRFLRSCSSFFLFFFSFLFFEGNSSENIQRNFSSLSTPE